MKIGELATRTGTPVDTIRYYERQRLLPAPPRSEGNYRLYSEVHSERLVFIRHARALGMNLEEIRTLLQLRDVPQAHCAEVNALLDAHIGHVAQRITALQALEAQLRALRHRCTGDGAVADCGILESLATAPNRPPEAACSG